MQSRERINEKQREYRIRNGNACTFKYERTYKGKIMRMYRNIKSRCEGIQKEKVHLYGGLPYMTKEEFYSWIMASEQFLSMYDAWVASGYDRKLCPTVDRIDSSRGYIAGNIRILTHSENSRRGNHARFKNTSNT